MKTIECLVVKESFYTFCPEMRTYVEVDNKSGIDLYIVVESFRTGQIRLTIQKPPEK